MPRSCVFLAMTILLLDDNLMSSTRLQRALETQGHAVTVAARPAPLPGCEVVLINLGSRSLPGIDFIAECRGLFPAAAVKGFCGHLEVEIRRAAKAAGIDQLLTNDQAFAGDVL